MVPLLRSQTSRNRFEIVRTGRSQQVGPSRSRGHIGGMWRCSRRVAGIGVLLAWAFLTLAGSTFGQDPGYHSLHHGAMLPGAIGSLQLERGGPLRGYFQPVQIKGPPGVVVAMAEAGNFTEGETAPIRVGLLIGQVYRFRVMNIPLNPGAEVFPTVEVIDRLYTPQDHEYRFPIVVELSHDDIMTALSGKFLTKVIYLEDPEMALPTGHPGGAQPSFDIKPGHNPMDVADQVGRPVAILRMGAIVPANPGELDMPFLFGCPPWVRPAVTATPASPRARDLPAFPPAPVTILEAASR